MVPASSPALKTSGYYSYHTSNMNVVQITTTTTVEFVFFHRFLTEYLNIFSGITAIESNKPKNGADPLFVLLFKKIIIIKNG